MLDKLVNSGAAAPNRRMGKGTVIAIGAIPVGLLLSGVLVWQSSYAAFTAVADGGANSWSAGTVALSGDDNSNSSGMTTANALFSPTNLKPGGTGTKCVQVTYGGSLAAGVRVYLQPLAAASIPLADQLDMTIEEGAGGTFGSCTGFTPNATPMYSGTLTALAASRTNFATGYGAWAPTAAAQTRVYRFTYTLKASAPNSVQGAAASATVTWEAQNT